MSLEQNEQEEGPGAFLSLSAQASSSPFRGPPAAEASPRVSIKQEEGDLETCLSLQQPSQQQPLDSAHKQESHRKHTLDQAGAPHIENPLHEHKAVDFSEQARLSLSEEHSEHQKRTGAVELQKSSSSEYEHPSSLRVCASTIAQVSQKQQSSGTTWLALQSAPSCQGLLQHQKSSSSLGHLECLNETSSPGSLAKQSLSFYDISEKKKPGLSLPVSPLQVSPKQEQHVNSAVEEQKIASSPESKKMPPSQPSLEQNSLLLHMSGEAEQGKAAPVLTQEQKSSHPLKGLVDHHNSHMYNHPDHQVHSLSQQWHNSVSTQAQVLQGHLDSLKAGPYAEQKFAFMQGYSTQQMAVSDRNADPQAISHSQLSQLQPGFKLQSPPTVMQDRTRVVFSKPTVLSTPVNPDALPKDKELKLPIESPLACSAAPQGSGHVYPAPLATHEAVLADRRLFMETLQSLHVALNSHVSVPNVEGVDVDLYKLYKEVTCRGGLEAVMKNGEWQDVVRAFNFPSNALNVSYILRKTYVSTLGHYEQVYFLGGCSRSTAPAAFTSQSSAFLEKNGRGSGDTNAGVHVMNGSTDSAKALGVDPASSVGAIVSGAIDGKFEDGYLVTVTVGARRMRGVLYHVASTDMPPQNVSVPGFIRSASSDIQSVDVVPKIGRKRKKREVFRKDPNAPRQNRTGYNFFFAEQRAKLKTLQPDKDRAISKMIGELWSKLSEDEKSPYQVKGVKDKERYVKEMKEYKEKVKLPSRGGLNEVHNSPPLLSQFPYSYRSPPLNDPKALPMQHTSTFVPGGSNSLKAISPQHSLAIVSEAVNDPMAMQPQFASTFISEAPNVSQIAPPQCASNVSQIAPPRMMKTTEQLTVEATSSSHYSTAASHSSCATDVNTTNAVTMLHAQISFPVSHPLVVAPTAVATSKILVDKTSPRSIPPQSGTQADADTETDAHVSTMKH